MVMPFSLERPWEKFIYHVFLPCFDRFQNVILLLLVSIFKMIKEVGRTGWGVYACASGPVLNTAYPGFKVHGIQIPLSPLKKWDFQLLPL